MLSMEKLNKKNTKKKEWYFAHTYRIQMKFHVLGFKERDTHNHLSILLRTVHAIKSVAANDVIPNGRTGERDGTHQIHNAIKSKTRQRLIQSATTHTSRRNFKAPEQTDIMSPNLIQYAHFLCEAKTHSQIRSATAQRIRNKKKSELDIKTRVNVWSASGVVLCVRAEIYD